MADLRQNINDDRDVRRVIKARRRDRLDRYHDTDDSDRFPMFTSNITDRSYPKNFKPVNIPKYWTSKTHASGSNSTKALYFLVALESAPLT
jgi:hypothetical protein